MYVYMHTKYILIDECEICFIFLKNKSQYKFILNKIKQKHPRDSACPLPRVIWRIR